MQHRPALIGLSFAALLFAAGQAPAKPALIPVADNPGGQSPEASVAQWMEWGLSFDAIADGGDPLSDATGAFQNKKQIYDVYMLGGSFGPGVTRSFKATPGKPFLVPFLAYTCVNTDPGGGGTDDCGGAQELGIAELVETGTDNLSLTVDGLEFVAEGESVVQALAPLFFVDTGPVETTAAPNNYYGAPEGTYPGSFTAGYFAFLDLPPGVYELMYGARIDEFGFETSVSATVTVVPVPAALPLLATGLIGLRVLQRARRRHA